jgi:hypothetical protein
VFNSLREHLGQDHNKTWLYDKEKSMELSSNSMETLYLPPPQTVHVGSVSGGASSLKMMIEMIRRYGKENCRFIYCYLPNEHPDTVLLVLEAGRILGVDIRFIGHGLTPMEWFFKRKFLGNSRIDPCSEGLKREVVKAYLVKHHDPRFTVLHVGVTYHEIDRMIAIHANWRRAGWQVVAILGDDPTITRETLMALCSDFLGWIPALYWLGFEHNNCHGACIKAGKAQWKHLLRTFPAVYAAWEQGEKLFRETYGDYTILTEMVDGQKRGITLEELRMRVAAQPALFDLDITPPCTYCAAV